MAGDDQELDEVLDLEPEQPTEPEPDEPEQESEPDEPEQQPEAQLAQPESREQPERQPSRRDTRIQTLVDEGRRKDQELADVRRRLDEISRQVQQPSQQAETPQQRAARFALMTPQEQMQEQLREAQQSFTTQMQQMQVQNAENADRTAFQARCAVDPLYAKWAPKVEGKLAELRTSGQNVNREALLRYLIGEAALEKRSGTEGKREVVQAQRRVQANRTRPANSGSDAQAQRRQGSSVERRLENVNI